ncbi:MAG: D-Ala-D-Ala carboxypeptidase family metallohydrolase [Xenococcus sp. (in: cyanobacteria)]
MDLSLIKKYEGCRLEAYRDSVGVPTIGYGCTFYPDGKKVKMGDQLRDEKEASNLLENLLKEDFLPIISQIPTWNQMNSHQKDAVLSFSYNLGARFFANPGFESITRLLQDPQQWNNESEVKRVFGLYVKAGGATLPGLVTRRAAEAELFCEPVAEETVAKLKMTALCDTWLKKDWTKQASQLDDTERAFVPIDKFYFFEELNENSLETQLSGQAGHAKVKLSYGAGEWYLFVEHWEFPWTEDTPPVLGNLPEWNEVQWDDWSSPVSKYFTAGEVAKYQRRRIPQDETIKKNVIQIARKLDQVRDWWGSPLLVNSWYRPLAVEREIGGSGANHPYGFAVDIRPKEGSVWDLQNRFEREWFDANKWAGGFGRGANKGFIHLDLRQPERPRKWNY